TFNRVSACSLAKYLITCPISPTYHIIVQHFYIPYPDEDELRFLLAGQYKLKLLAHDSDDSKRIALCVEIHFTLHS
uniref:Uncharacterized protein n=1 Tax=Romanomermis culicivorax TaxID=13658 RepID=A0A915JQY7_ROMCU